LVCTGAAADAGALSDTRPNTTAVAIPKAIFFTSVLLGCGGPFHPVSHGRHLPVADELNLKEPWQDKKVGRAMLPAGIESPELLRVVAIVRQTGGLMNVSSRTADCGLARRSNYAISSDRRLAASAARR
jgi:hypothetical protein